MKNLIIYSFLMSLAFSATSQGVGEWEEAKIIDPPIEILTLDANKYQYVVNEKFSGEFAEDPIKFMEENFNIQDLMVLAKDKKYDSYLVTISNRKGSLKASYSRDGKLMKTSMKFKNILVPAAVRHELYKNHKGWQMVKNSYRASGKENLLEKETYRIKLIKGNKSRVVKIDLKFIPSSLVSSE